jgi:hypothetical protein
MRRARRVLAVALGHGLLARFERRAAVDHRALFGRPRTDARAERARREIAVAFVGAGFLDPAFDAHLALELDPVEQQRRVRMGGEVAALAAFVIGKEDEPAFVDTLDEHDSGRRPAVRADGGERHRVGLGELGGERLLEPAIELCERVGGGIGFIERSTRIVDAEIGESRHVMQTLQSGASIANARESCVHSGACRRGVQAK